MIVGSFVTGLDGSTGGQGRDPKKAGFDVR
jgi:hypothetical protein